MQRDIGRAIANEIHIQLTPRETARLAQVGTVSPAAHEAYLKGTLLLEQTNLRRVQKEHRVLQPGDYLRTDLCRRL
jgi:hypothetical protein